VELQPQWDDLLLEKPLETWVWRSSISRMIEIACDMEPSCAADARPVASTSSSLPANGGGRLPVDS
jgi:hypothetical protein